MGFNPAQGMDVCVRPSALCCTVSKYTLKVKNVCVVTSKKADNRQKNVTDEVKKGMRKNNCNMHGKVLKRSHFISTQ